MAKTKDIMKQSLLIGALTSSFGVFISKAIGLVYYSPLSSLAGEENMVFYSVTYTYYDILLKISSAGIPFAIAALVAKYVAKGDYKTSLIVKKLGTSLVMAFSFVSAFIFLLISEPLARKSMGSMASVKDIEQLKTLFLILIIAVILVPYLSTLRSYYQGLKRLDLYASSQVLEQFVRVFFILVCGYVCVKIIKLDNIWTIYMAIAAAGIAAFVAIIFMKFFTRDDDIKIKKLIKEQQSEALTKKEIFKEIISLGIPYLLISFFGTATPIINTTFFLDYVTQCGMDQESAQLSLGIMQANCSKLLAIPQVLTSGFCTGLVPYLTESWESHDFNKLNKQIIQIIDTVLFILIPSLLIFFFFAKDIYSIMYGVKNLELGSTLFKYTLALGLTETVLPILSSIMITLRLKRESVLTLIGVFVLKFATFFVSVKYLYAAGMVTSTCFASICAMIAYFIILHVKFKISFTITFKRLLMIIISSFIMVIPAVLLHNVVPIDYTNRLYTLVIMTGLGILMLNIYYFITCKFTLVQKIFGINDPNIIHFIKRFKL